MPDREEFKVHLDRPYEAHELQSIQSRALRSFGPPPSTLEGRGIVTSAFDREFTSCWVLLSELIRLGTTLPIELWYRSGELNATNMALLLDLPLQLTVQELTDDVSGYAIKPVALWRSRFREVLWLDADNFPLRDPAFLFDDPEYVGKGSLFWRDTSGAERARFWHAESSVWQVFGVPPNDAEEFETGQLLIDKSRCWTELCLTACYAFSHAFYYHFLLGDKDTFRLAWQRLAYERGRPFPPAWYHADPANVPYGMMPYGPFHVGRPNRWGAWGGGTVLIQRDRNGRPLFHHRNTEKFSSETYNHFNADAPNEAFYHAHVTTLARLRIPQGREKLPPAPVASPSFTARPQVSCAWGEVFDRLTILDLKCDRIVNPAARGHVAQERAAIEAVIGDRSRFPAGLDGLIVDLAAVNAALWDIEDAIRVCERAQCFDDGFIALARDVYRQNDRRAVLKRRISLLLGSDLVEEKLYATVDPPAGDK